MGVAFSWAKKYHSRIIFTRVSKQLGWDKMLASLDSSRVYGRKFQNQNWILDGWDYFRIVVFFIFLGGSISRMEPSSILNVLEQSGTLRPASFGSFPSSRPKSLPG
jgi:hypothetical protein